MNWSVFFCLKLGCTRMHGRKVILKFTIHVIQELFLNKSAVKWMSMVTPVTLPQQLYWVSNWKAEAIATNMIPVALFFLVIYFGQPFTEAKHSHMYTTDNNKNLTYCRHFHSRPVAVNWLETNSAVTEYISPVWGTKIPRHRLSLGSFSFPLFSLVKLDERHFIIVKLPANCKRC